ncbi:MAG: pyridoxal phosphate-dependent aminotransferase family protein, partial [Pirellulales bacterium]|nr:pyridoxal phosphate-dependent aminotransferase family protein [Pirellulales bacterium]
CVKRTMHYRLWCVSRTLQKFTAAERRRRCVPTEDRGNEWTRRLNPKMHVLQSPPDAVVTIDGREYLYFVGTGYLGLQCHPEVIEVACRATERYGIHSATTRAGFGNSPPLLEAERRAAELFDAPAAFYFATGYAGNAILLAALQDRFDALFADELSHYSVLEAARQTRLPLFTFHHRDTDDLAAAVQKNLGPGRRPLLLTDGVFSVRGTIAPLAEYRDVLSGYPGAGMLIDDAHAVGVLGRHGRGTLEHFGLWRIASANSPLPLGEGPETNSPLPLGEGPGVRAASSGQWSVVSGQSDFPNLKSQISHQQISNPQSLIPNPSIASPHPGPLPAGEGTDFATFLTATASKAIGGFGGIIPGSLDFIERVKRSSHWFDGASAPVAPAAAATAKAIELLMADPDRRARLRSNVRKFKDGLRGLGLEVDDSPVPILCLTLGDADNMRRIQSELMQRGIAVA